MTKLFALIKSKFQLHLKSSHLYMISRMIFNGHLDRFKGFHIQLTTDSHFKGISNQEFESSLEEALVEWTTKSYRVSWFRVNLLLSHFIPSLVKFGYVFHHSKTDYVVMNKWLSTTEPKNIPNYAFTNIGVGGLVVDDNDKVLVVKEQHFIGKQMWKYPGGYATQGEDFGQTAVREVLEETGIECRFESVIAFRHIHEFAFECSDIYFVCLLKPLKSNKNSCDLEVKKCSFEIDDCKWFAIEDLRPQLSQFNLYVIEKFLSNRNNKIKIGFESIPSIIKSVELKTYSIHTDF